MSTKKRVYRPNKKYRTIVVFSHPNARYDGAIFLHRYLMSNHIGRPLRDNEIVHHINGNTHDNRLQNLRLMTRKEHDSHHRIIKKRRDRI